MPARSSARTRTSTSSAVRSGGASSSRSSRAGRSPGRRAAGSSRGLRNTCASVGVATSCASRRPSTRPSSCAVSQPSGRCVGQQRAQLACQPRDVQTGLLDEVVQALAVLAQLLRPGQSRHRQLAVLGSGEDPVGPGRAPRGRGGSACSTPVPSPSGRCSRRVPGRTRTSRRARSGGAVPVSASSSDQLCDRLARSSRGYGVRRLVVAQRPEPGEVVADERRQREAGGLDQVLGLLERPARR